MIRRFGVAIATITLCAGFWLPPGPAAEELEAAVEAQIDSLMSSLTPPLRIEGEPIAFFKLEERMAHHKVPGVSAAYFSDGRIVWARAWGVKDVTTRAPMTTETRLQAASISKPVAVVAMLTLVEDGLLDLDRNVNRYLQSWQLPENEFTAQQRVTLRLIAAHGAGLTVHGFLGYAPGQPVPTTLQVLDGVPPANSKPIRVDVAPGSTTRYSGGGFVVMQLLMEDVTGEAFTPLMRQRVLDPLGMTHSTFEQPPSAPHLDQLATAHDDEGNPIEGGYHVYPEMAAAGLWTTPSDLASFVIDVQRTYAGATNGLLSPAMVRDMLEPSSDNRGLGFALRSVDGEVTSFLHGGGNEGFRDLLFAHLSGDGLVVMTNGDNGGDVWREIFMAAGHVFGWPEFEPSIKVVHEMPPQTLAGYAGTYHVTDPIEVDVVVQRLDRGLSIQAIGYGAAEEYFPESETVFFTRKGDQARFEIPENGGPPQAVYFGTIRAGRVD